jgi:hypothetical protein
MSGTENVPVGKCPGFPFLRLVVFKEMSGFCKKLSGILDPRIPPFRSSGDMEKTNAVKG